MRRRRSENVRELLYKVLAILYRYSEDFAVIEHPRSMMKRSIDLAVRLKDGKRLIIKVAYDIDEIPRSEIQELLSLATLLQVSPLIIAVMKSGEPLLEGVVYEKGGIKAVSPETLENVLSGAEPAYIRVEKSSYTLSIDGETMRKRRLELNLSLGDLASMLGVSRRTIYEYEKGSMEPSIEKAEILIKILGEDIAKPIDLFTPSRNKAPKSVPYDTIVEQMLASRLEQYGYKVTHVRRTALDIAASNEEKRMAIVVEHPSRSSTLLDKVYYLNKLADTVGISERYVIVETSKTEKTLEKEGYEAIKLEDFLEIVVSGSDERSLPDRSSRKRENNNNK